MANGKIQTEDRVVSLTKRADGSIRFLGEMGTVNRKPKTFFYGFYLPGTMFEDGKLVNARPLTFRWWRAYDTPEAYKDMMSVTTFMSRVKLTLTNCWYPKRRT